MGTLQTNPPTIPNNVTDSWQPLVERDAMSYYGKNEVTLTNWDDSTTKPAVAQGSMIDIDGSLATFTTEEAIGGAPADGILYLKFTVSGAVVTPVFTSEAPTWDSTKAGWYNASGERYSGHYMTLTTAEYTDKLKAIDSVNGLLTSLGAYGGIRTDDVTIRTKLLTGVSSGNFPRIPHGLDWNTIVGIDYCLQNDAGIYIVGGDSWIDGNTKAVSFDSDTVNLDLAYALDGRNYRILVRYIAQ